MSVSIRFVKPADLKSTVRGLAIMSVLYGKDDCRFWTDAGTGADLAAWRDAGGGSCYFLFQPKAAVVVGSDPESPMCARNNPAISSAWPGVFDEMPKDLSELVKQNPFGGEFKFEESTFAIWNTGKGLDWKKGKIDYPKRDNADPDGSRVLLGKIREYYDHFEDVLEEEYDMKCDHDALFVLFSGEPVGVDELRKVKSDLNVETLREPLKVIGVTV